MIRLIFSLLITILASTAVAGDKKTIAVLGSSVASGWVTSFEKRYDMLNGYAARLGRLLESRGFSVVNLSVPGDSTKDVMARMEKELEAVDPDMVIIGLSLGNEGEDPATAFASFEKGMQGIIEKCRALNAVPIAGSCYVCDHYGREHYRYTKKMNLMMNEWGVPVINFLGALDDGNGHFVEGHTYDDSHPDNRGQEEMFYAVAPGLFEALQAGKPAPARSTGDGFTTIKESTLISFVPRDIIHSFALAFTVRAGNSSTLTTVANREGATVLKVDEKGRLTYGAIESGPRIADEKWHDVVLSHRYLKGETLLFVDGKKVGVTREKLEPLRFALGEADYRDFMVYRSSLNADEAKALHEGALLQGSLEVYLPLREAVAKPLNLAQNVATVQVDSHGDTASLVSKLEEADLLRIREPEFKEKVPVDLDPVIYDSYVGDYSLAPGVNLTISREGDRLYLTDPEGGKAELYPESETSYFIKFPLAEITVGFVRNDKGRVHELVFSMGGRKDRAKKIT